MGRVLAPDSRIAVIRLGGLAEVVQSLPLACAIKQQYPGCHITWVTDETSADLLLDHAAIDRVNVFPRSIWRHRGLLTWIRGLYYARGMLRSTRLDFAIDLQGNTESSILIRLSGADFRWTAGGPAAAWLAGASRKENPGPSNPLAQLLGALQADPNPDFGFEPSPSGRQGADRLFRKMGIPPDAKPIALVAFSSAEAAAWPESRYVRVGTQLCRQGYGPILIIGDPGDREEGRYLARRIGPDARSLAGEAGPLVMREALRRCRAAVGNDTGWTYLAAALGVPTAILYGPTKPSECLPVPAHPVTAHVSCSPCRHTSCRSLVCQRRISPGTVYRLVLGLLSSPEDRTDVSHSRALTAPMPTKRRWAVEPRRPSRPRRDHR